MNILIETSACAGALALAGPGGNKSVVAGLHYLRPTRQRPHSYACEPPPGVAWENCAYDRHDVAIADARQASVRPSLEREGFELRDAPTAVRDFLDVDVVRSIYYREATELALGVTGATRAFVFDHLVRRREHDRAPLTFGRRGSDGLPSANGRVHNDYTEASGRRRLQMVLADRDAAARVRRYSIVNIWRSIRGPVLDTPLAVCDARTVMAADLAVSDVRYPHRTGEIYVAVHSPLHRWSYFPEMDRGEALVFKQYDSQQSGVTRFTPHAAFDLPEIPPGAPLRQSIELRCLVVHDDAA